MCDVCALCVRCVYAVCTLCVRCVYAGAGLCNLEIVHVHCRGIVHACRTYADRHCNKQCFNNSMLAYRSLHACIKRPRRKLCVFCTCTILSRCGRSSRQRRGGSMWTCSRGQKLQALLVDIPVRVQGDEGEGVGEGGRGGGSVRGEEVKSGF